MNKVSSLPVCLLNSEPTPPPPLTCPGAADRHHRPQLRRGVDAGLRGVPGRPEPGNLVREQPDPLHEPGAGRVLHQPEGTWAPRERTALTNRHRERQEF